MKFCPICAAVSGTWLVLSAGVAWGFLTPSAWLIPVALLMGGSVIGIANKMENHKKLIIVLGMPIAYLLVTNLTKTIVIAELIVMMIIAYILFRNNGPDNQRVHEIEEKMKQCC